MNKTTLQDIGLHAHGMDSVRVDYKASSGSLLALDTGQVGLKTDAAFEKVNGSFDPTGPAPLHLSNYALGQLASRLEIKYGRAFFTNNPTLPQHVMADTINHFTAITPDKEFLVRQFNGEIRGVCGFNYLVMDHSWLIEQAIFFMTDPSTGQVRDHFVAPGYRIEPDYMKADVIFQGFSPNGGSDGVYGLGFSLRNGTVGNASAGVVGLTMRTSCTNSIRERRRDWTVRHVGSTDILAMRESLIIASLAEATKSGKDLAERMIRARKQRLPNIFDIVDSLVEGQRLSEQIVPFISQGTEGENSLFGLVNGLTFAAKTEGAQAHLTPDASEDLESLAGLLLTKYADGETAGDALARQLFQDSSTKAHLEVSDDKG